MSKIQTALVIAVLGAAIGFGAGWVFNGWRLGAQIAILKTNLNTCEQNEITLTAALDSQKAKIEAWKSKADETQEAAQRAQEEAKREAKTLEDQIDELSKREGQTCADAVKLIDEAFGL